MGIGLDDYKFGRKNNWRRWSWNRCFERIEVQPSKAVCLILPSAQNLDTAIALSHGIRATNIFAVERNKKIRDSLRDQKVNVIDGDIKDVILAWGKEPKINIIHADLCSPLNKWAFDFAWSLLATDCTEEKTVIVLNLLRGRDASSNLFREALLKKGAGKLELKHRGYQFLLTMMLQIETLIRCDKFGILKLPREGDPRGMKEIIISICDHFWKMWKPQFNSYKSTSGQVMDSVVVSHDGYLSRAIISRCLLGNHPRVYNMPEYVSDRRRIAAAKAIRTMRAA